MTQRRVDCIDVDATIIDGGACKVAKEGSAVDVSAGVEDGGDGGGGSVCKWCVTGERKVVKVSFKFVCFDSPCFRFTMLCFASLKLQSFALCCVVLLEPTCVFVPVQHISHGAAIAGDVAVKYPLSTHSVSQQRFGRT